MPLIPHANALASATLPFRYKFGQITKSALAAFDSVLPDGWFKGLITVKINPVSVSTAGNVTYSAAQLLGGLINRDTNGAARTDVTDTAANIVASIPNVAVGAGFYVTIRNVSGAANAITLNGGTGVTISGTNSIPQNNAREFLAVVTNATKGSEAVTLYSLGGSTF